MFRSLFYRHLATDTGTSSSWQHVAFKFDGEYFSVYYNGVLTAGPLKTKSCAKHVGFIGGRATSADYFNGYIDEIKVWDTVISDAEIKAEATP